MKNKSEYVSIFPHSFYLLNRQIISLFTDYKNNGFRIRFMMREHSFLGYAGRIQHNYGRWKHLRLRKKILRTASSECLSGYENGVRHYVSQMKN